MSLVSVITTIKDHPDYEWLTRASMIARVNSCPIQWIVVASPEEHERLNEMLDFDPIYVPVEVESTKNVAAARNAGLKQASGAYVMQFDADDIPLPLGVSMVLDAIEKKETLWGGAVAIDYAQDETPDFVFPDAWKDFSDGLILPGDFRKFRKEVQSSSDGRFPVGMYPAHPSSCLVNTNLALMIGGWDESMPILEDYGFIGRVAALTEGVWVREPAFVYRRAGLSESSKPISDQQWSMLEEHISSFEENPLGDIQ
jgi:glycosyltransferase involved in cell wall biosynthesis